jgi:hypothetical protein
LCNAQIEARKQEKKFVIYKQKVIVKIGFEKSACGRACVSKMPLLASRSLRIGFVKGYLVQLRQKICQTLYPIKNEPECG